MFETRRSILRRMAGAATLAAAGVWVSGEAQTPSPMPSPNAPRNQNVPGGFDGPPLGRADRMQNNPLLQQQIAASVQQLYKLAVELKDEAEHTNMSATFSLNFVKKAQQIEKLAKQIKDKSKG